MADIEEEFGKIVRKLRENKGLSQDAFADLAGLDRSYQGRIERGEVSVTLRTIQVLSKTFGLKATQFFDLLKKSGL